MDNSNTKRIENEISERMKANLRTLAIVGFEVVFLIIIIWLLTTQYSEIGPITFLLIVIGAVIILTGVLWVFKNLYPATGF